MKKLIALILAAIMCVCLVACGGEAEQTFAPDTNGAGNPEFATVVNELETLLAALKAGDEETIIALSGSDAAREDELLLEMLVAMFSKLEYTVGNVTDNGDGTATVALDVSAVSVTSVFNEYMLEAAKHMDDDNWDADGAEFIKICGSDKVSKESKSIDVKLESDAGEWSVSEDNEELINALFGGLIG